VGGHPETPRVAAPRPAGYEQLNRYTAIVVDEALRRGIAVEVADAASGELVLEHGGVRHTTIESLSDLTTAVAFRRCDHKVRTRQVLTAAGLVVAPGQPSTGGPEDAAFLAEHRDIVVKPARGEQGWGVTVGVVDAPGLDDAIARAAAIWPEVLLEARRDGLDLRVIVIGGAVVAAAVRRPASVTGDGVRTIGALIAARNDERAGSTGGAAQIPLDEVTAGVVAAHGRSLDDVLAAGAELEVRRTANLHTGGTMHDVTAELHPALAAASVAVATAIEIPVVGVDLIVPAVDGPTYTIIEANEQPGLANHEPQPTVERFLDLLFPATAT
jgi:GNAT-family acetyltransferase (TIGR03103 family)